MQISMVVEKKKKKLLCKKDAETMKETWVSAIEEKVQGPGKL